MDTNAITKTGVLLVNLGTPEAPTPVAVRQFLGQFLHDKRVIELPRAIWCLLLHGIILRVRPARLAKQYASIWWKDGSPMRVILAQQQAALQSLLGEAYCVEMAMTYGEPSIGAGIARLQKSGMSEIVFLPLYPQNSATTVGAVFDAVARFFKQTRNISAHRFIAGYATHPLYIQALAQSITNYWDKHGRGDKLLLSFHGIPKRYSDSGDPYIAQCHQTAEAVAEALDLAPSMWQAVFQSRFGAAQWVEPYTDVVLKQLACEGIKRVDVVSPAFSADCIETLEELDERGRALFFAAGGEQFHYIPALNAESNHIQLMAALVKQT